MMEFVAATVRRRKVAITLADRGQFDGQTGQLLRDQMDDLAFAIRAALMTSTAY